MKKIAAVVALGLALALAPRVVGEGEVPDAEPTLEDLHWLAGRWSGTDGRNEWEACYTTPLGGTIASANKEMRDGATKTVDFEVFREEDGKLVLTPYPFGKRSRDFPLAALDRAKKKAVFENPEHDFPSRFTYQRVDDDHLRIVLEGEPGGQTLRIELNLESMD